MFATDCFADELKSETEKLFSSAATDIDIHSPAARQTLMNMDALLMLVLMKDSPKISPVVTLAAGAMMDATGSIDVTTLMLLESILNGGTSSLLPLMMTDSLGSMVDWCTLWRSIGLTLSGTHNSNSIGSSNLLIYILDLLEDAETLLLLPLAENPVAGFNPMMMGLMMSDSNRDLLLLMIMTGAFGECTGQYILLIHHRLIGHLNMLFE